MYFIDTPPLFNQARHMASDDPSPTSLLVCDR
jgi:hypothetical protein